MNDWPTPYFDSLRPEQVQFAKRTLTLLLAAVKEDPYRKLKYHQNGICRNWEEFTYKHWSAANAHNCSIRAYRLVSELGASWPESAHKGQDTCQPIMNWNGSALWRGEQLRLRISLINYILECLDERLKEMET